MIFTARPTGSTLRRQARDALLRPHGTAERFDPELNVVMRCESCGKHAYGPRKHMAEAMREHRASDCPMRHSNADSPQVTRILYPRQ